MGKVLTKDSTVSCNHSGSATFSPTSSKLTVGGTKVLLKADVEACTITGCTFTPPPPGRIPCTGVTSVLLGVATKLTVGGAGVVLESLTGITNSSVPGSLTGVSAGQSKLTAT